MKYTVEYYPYNYQEGDKVDLFHFETKKALFTFVDIQLRSINDACGLDFNYVENNVYQLSEYRSEVQLMDFKIIELDKNEKSIIDINHSLN